MIQSYDLYMPVHLVFGRGRIAELPKLIAGYGKKVLLTYGGGSVKRIGLYDKVKALLAAEGCTVFELSGIEPNPKIESVRAGVEICKKEGIDFILAIGGGSTLDCSKAIALGAKYDGDPWDLVIHRDRVKGHLPVFDVLTLAPQMKSARSGSASRSRRSSTLSTRLPSPRARPLRGPRTSSRTRLSSTLCPRARCSQTASANRCCAP